MSMFTVHTTLDGPPLIGPFAEERMRMFGLRRDFLRRSLHCRLQLKPGQICFVSGPSGSGKSLLLNALYAQIEPDARTRPEAIGLETEATVIDCICTQTDDPAEALKTLGMLGLGDDAALLTAPAALSSSRQWQYRLARMLLGGKPWLFADDFTALLDRVSACVLAYHLRTFIRAAKQILVLASCHDEMLADLRPDVLVTLTTSGGAHVDYADRDGG